jgi:transcriptional regulator with XRE-family HTH domain
MGFKENLKAEFSYKDMLVKELATYSGVNKRTIDNYLREKGSIPSADAAVSIARVLGVSVEYLLTGHEIHPEKAASPLAPDLRIIFKFLEALNDRDRKIVFNLVKSLYELEDSEKK